MSPDKIALIGAGTIGRGWAVLFAKAGYTVRVYDGDDAAMKAARTEIGMVIARMKSRSIVDDAGSALERISFCGSLEDAISGSTFIQESIPEIVDNKRDLLSILGSLADPRAIISSSCSSLAPDEIFGTVSGGGRCIVSHPFNPPYLMRLVELLPSRMTDERTISETKELMRAIGQVPVIINDAVPGYVANRLQVAVVNEAMYLVDKGVISPDDLDLCMTASLGPRWSLLGPFATMDLNSDGGVAGYADSFRHVYEEVGADLRVAQAWTDNALRRVVAARRQAVPIEALRKERESRDDALMTLFDPAAGAGCGAANQSSPV